MGERGVATIWKDPVIRLMRGLGTRGSADGDNPSLPPFLCAVVTPLYPSDILARKSKDTFPIFLVAEKGYLPCPIDLLSSSFSNAEMCPGSPGNYSHFNRRRAPGCQRSNSLTIGSGAHAGAMAVARQQQQQQQQLGDQQQQQQQLNGDDDPSVLADPRGRRHSDSETQVFPLLILFRNHLFKAWSCSQTCNSLPYTLGEDPSASASSKLSNSHCSTSPPSAAHGGHHLHGGGGGGRITVSKYLILEIFLLYLSV